jgi:hypothetical protein
MSYYINPDRRLSSTPKTPQHLPCNYRRPFIANFANASSRSNLDLELSLHHPRWLSHSQQSQTENTVPRVFYFLTSHLRFNHHLSHDMVGLPFLSPNTTAFFWAKCTMATVERMSTWMGIIMTIKYNATLLSLQRVPQCGFASMLIAAHWQLQLCREEVVFEPLTP